MSKPKPLTKGEFEYRMPQIPDLKDRVRATIEQGWAPEKITEEEVRDAILSRRGTFAASDLAGLFLAMREHDIRMHLSWDADFGTYLVSADWGSLPYRPRYIHHAARILGALIYKHLHPDADVSHLLTEEE